MNTKIGVTTAVLFALTSWVASASAQKAGEDFDTTHPDELRQHRCLHYGYQDTGNRWHLLGPNGEQSFAINCVLWSNNGEALRNAAVEEQGIVLLPTFIAGEAL